MIETAQLSLAGRGKLVDRGMSGGWGEEMTVVVGDEVAEQYVVLAGQVVELFDASENAEDQEAIVSSIESDIQQHQEMLDRLQDSSVNGQQEAESGGSSGEDGAVSTEAVEGCRAIEGLRESLLVEVEKTFARDLTDIQSQSTLHTLQESYQSHRHHRDRQHHVLHTLLTAERDLDAVLERLGGGDEVEVGLLNHVKLTIEALTRRVTTSFTNNAAGYPPILPEYPDTPTPLHLRLHIQRLQRTLQASIQPILHLVTESSTIVEDLRSSIAVEEDGFLRRRVQAFEDAAGRAVREGWVEGRDGREGVLLKALGVGVGSRQYGV
ncbi:hypothetical protein HDU67_008041 [Dinochytrium kinnereticum]|nr:hypothetical protein HDU67_008041 [Dinochytrium kinnereticum]